jgi:hypothetical protein
MGRGNCQAVAMAKGVDPEINNQEKLVPGMNEKDSFVATSVKFHK